MADYAQIENGKVVNVVVSDPLHAAEQSLVVIPEGSGAGIGWSYVNGQFVDNRPVLAPEIAPAPTKEQLLAQLQALQAQIQALE